MRTLGEIQPGQTVGRYEFLVPIAQGGMAAVWAARLKGSRGFSKNVAVKTMLPTISDNPHFEQMFLDEATIASRIRHPNVVEILDLGEQDDLLYLVMEWVDGEPLSTIRRAAAKKDGIPRPIAVKIVQDAAAGLNAAHELKDEAGKVIGLVHRDISPQNILITYDGVVKIVDFGVAKAAGRTAEHTNSGQIKGKPPYMSPEQALGKDIDRRTDVFALGIILYQLTTGKHPFRGENDMITLQNIVSDRPIIPPRAYDKEYPKPLENAVLKALNRDPEKRFQSAAELETALDRAFPPTVARVRDDDVGKFVTSLMGDRGDERRAALREAIKLADERAAQFEQNRPSGNFPALGTRVGSNPILGPADQSRPSHPGVTPGSLSMPFRPGSAPDFGSSAFSAPETPIGTHLPTEPPPLPKKSRGALWIVGGITLAALFIGAAVLITKATASSRASADQAPASGGTTVAANEKPSGDPAKPPEPTKEKLDETGAIDLKDLSVEKEKAAAVQQRPVGPKTAAEAKAAKEAKEKEAKAAKETKETKETKKPGGFVPPPVTDPGF